MTNGNRVLSSDWTGLSPHLIAKFYPVERKHSDNGKSYIWQRSSDSTEVHAPLTDGAIETTINWHSPFESVGADQKLASFSALLQSGGFTDLLLLIKEKLGGADGGVLDTVGKQLKTLEGRSSVTKLNSTQIFNGMPPIKINLTAHFRAIRDPDAEVRRPMDQLMQWALPQKLALDGPVTSTIKGDPALYPSEIPQIIGMQYADMLFLPMVIESAPFPLTVPRDKNGRMLGAQMALSIASLTALDKNDWAGSVVR